ncbi:MAG: lysine--tRNA ligase [Nanoarchaeota archaeon]|nr:lysine--tRNA ligase [Nanoarchaeota archaeon]MBU4456464.1 lysine--tRNA ligase [Nanoarchaeota archaeon]MCG2720336.1 lysine--tRNA ligase [Nanoarchaeota archaeon]
MNPEEQLVNDRIAKIKRLKEKGIEPYPYNFDKKNDAIDLFSKFNSLNAGEHSKSKVKVAGRMLSLRLMGGAAFAHILDNTGKIQLYFAKNNLKNYKDLKLFDMGDFIGVEGVIFKTKKGELSIEVKKFKLLSKSLRPLPEKWHGLQDTEIRYRKRYLDFISNPEVKQVFEKRAKILSLIRQFMEKKGFVEVDIPVLQPIYGGASAKPFKTHINAWDLDLFLSISPELYLKRLIIGGFEKVYTICKNFRNEGVDRTHNPEFTMMECYWAYKDYEDMMKLTEELFEFVCLKLFGTTKITYQGNKIDFKKPWKRIAMIDAIKKYTNINVKELNDADLKKLLKDYKIKSEQEFNRDLAIQAIFEELVEEKLIQPTFIVDHPKATSPLCKVHKDHPELLDRFEPYVMGWELGNAYSELNDPREQKKLLQEQAESGKRGDSEAHQMDEDFITALEHGMPPTGGLGIGIDRMIMLLTDAKTIRDVIAFPTMRPEKND